MITRKERYKSVCLININTKKSLKNISALNPAIHKMGKPLPGVYPENERLGQHYKNTNYIKINNMKEINMSILTETEKSI